MPITYIFSSLSVILPIMIVLIILGMKLIETHYKTDHAEIREQGSFVNGNITDFWISGSISKNGVNPVGIEYKIQNKYKGFE